MAFNVTGLTNYVNQNTGLIRKAIAVGNTAQRITIQPNIKHSATVNTVSEGIVLQAGSCGFNPAGTTTLSQRTLTVDAIKLNETMCLKDLEKTFLSLSMNAGSYNTELPLEEVFINSKLDAVKKIKEMMLWQADKATGSGNLALSNGFLKMFDAEITSAPRLGSYTIATLAANIIDIVDEMVAKIPEDLLAESDLTLFVSPSTFRTYTKALRDANLYNYPSLANGTTPEEIVIPSTNVTMVATVGLVGKNVMVLSNASNLVMGTDLVSDEDFMKVAYDEFEDLLKINANFKIGTQVQFIENVIYYKGV